MGIGQFRREVQRWLSGALFPAQQDAQSASRMPTEVDPVDIIDQRVVDAVEEAVTDSGSRNTTRTPHDIQPQAPLTDPEMSVMYGMGYELIRRMNGGQVTSTPLAHVPMPRSDQPTGTPDHARSSAPEAAAASNTVNADAATVTVAEELHGLVQEPPTCRICLGPENEVDGPLQAFGVACNHVFHMQCIMNWAQTRARPDCPVCRQGLSLEALVWPTPTRPPQSGLIDFASFLITGDAFAWDSLRRSTLEDHISFIARLGLVDRLPTPAHGPGSQLPGLVEAARFAERWFRNRQIAVNEYFRRINRYVSRNEEDMETYWIECKLAETKMLIPPEGTASWETAFHGSNMSCLYSILMRGFLDTGPRAKRSTRHGHKYQYGVYCHKHGTRKKAANYMKYFEYEGIIAAPLFQLKVRDDYIACGDQWVCDPFGVQIESVWIHIVPIRSVGLNRYYIVASPWQSSYELYPIAGAPLRRYSLDEPQRPVR